MIIKFLIKAQDYWYSSKNQKLKKIIDEVLKELKEFILKNENYSRMIFAQLKETNNNLKFKNPYFIKEIILLIFHFDIQYNQGSLNIQENSYIGRFYKNSNQIHLNEQIEFNNEIHENIRNFMNNRMKFQDFNNINNQILERIIKIMNDSEKSPDIIISFIKNGDFSDLIHLLNFYNTSTYIRRKINDLKDYSIYQNIFTILIISGYLEKNILNIFFNYKFLKTCFLCADEKEEVNIEIMTIQFEFYLLILKHLKNEDIKINPKYFLEIVFQRSYLINDIENLIVKNF